MRGNVSSLNNILETIGNQDIDNQVYISEILSMRLVELRRKEIAKRTQDAEQAYREGRVKKGNIEDLWKDLND